MSFWVSSVIPLSLVVLCFVALFLFGIVLLVLRIVLRLGGCRLLVMFIAQWLLMLILLVIVGVRFLHWEFIWIVGLVLFGQDFD